MSATAQNEAHRLSGHLRSARGKSPRYLARRYSRALDTLLIAQDAAPTLHTGMGAREHVAVSLGLLLLEDPTDETGWHELRDLLAEHAEKPKRKLPSRQSVRKLKLRLRRVDAGEEDGFEDLPPYWIVFGVLSYLSRTGRLPSEDLDAEEEEVK